MTGKFFTTSTTWERKKILCAPENTCLFSFSFYSCVSVWPNMTFLILIFIPLQLRCFFIVFCYEILLSRSMMITYFFACKLNIFILFQKSFFYIFKALQLYWNTLQDWFFCLDFQSYTVWDFNNYLMSFHIYNIYWIIALVYVCFFFPLGMLDMDINIDGIFFCLLHLSFSLI